MYILGISCHYHDAAACLIKDGVLLAAAEEERFTRKKHDPSFPFQAIAFCLAKAGITIDNIDHVAFYEKPLLKFERLLFQHVQIFPKSIMTFLPSMPNWLGEKLRIQSLIKRKLRYRGSVHFIHHHMAHAAAGFLVSPFERAAICTLDGVGEWTTTALGYAENTKITLTKHIPFPHSLGLLYSTITGYLGFSVNNSEYKVMGLAPNGNPNTYYEPMKRLIRWKDDGSYRLDMTYFDFHWANYMPSKKLCDLFGSPPREKESALSGRHADIAAALQRVLEEVEFTILRHLYAETKCPNLVIGGGVALNSVANGKVLRETPFERLWIHPNATDGGSAVGAAYYLYHAILGHPRTYQFTNPFLGPSFSDQEIESFLDKQGIIYNSIKDKTILTEHIADLLWDNKVVGWFQGGMEWGPRALGGRSILANPCNPEMKAILNEKVKHREPFRPFAPVVCREDAMAYFECDDPIPAPTDFMLMVYPVRSEYRERLPAITHVDGSGRLQTIRREQQPLYYEVIKAFGRRSGIPVLVNTSFNIRGEPIVCTPHDAYRCMMGTGIDCLVIGSYFIWRHENPAHQWDSESLARD